MSVAHDRGAVEAAVVVYEHRFDILLHPLRGLCDYRAVACVGNRPHPFAAQAARARRSSRRLARLALRRPPFGREAPGEEK